MKIKKMYPSEKELEAVRQEGVIEVVKLQAGTTILIETVKHVFEFIVEQDQIYVSSSNTEIISGKQSCKIAGCVNADGTLFAGLIVKDKHLIINLNGRRYVTGLVKSGSVRGKGWAYEIWGQNEE